MNYAVQGNILRLGSGATAKFIFPIKEAVSLKDMIIVVLEVPADHFLTENVYGVAQNGEISWQIEKIPETSTDRGNFYVGISSCGLDSVHIANWNDMIVEVDVETGRIRSKRQGRFT